MPEFDHVEAVLSAQPVLHTLKSGPADRRFPDGAQTAYCTVNDCPVEECWTCRRANTPTLLPTVQYLPSLVGFVSLAPWQAAFFDEGIWPADLTWPGYLSEGMGV